VNAQFLVKKSGNINTLNSEAAAFPRRGAGVCNKTLTFGR
jgi:hypothetical protein